MQVIDRAGIRLDMLQRIVSCLENSQAGLLAALVLTLDAPSWQHASEPQVSSFLLLFPLRQTISKKRYRCVFKDHGTRFNRMPEVSCSFVAVSPCPVYISTGGKLN